PRMVSDAKKWNLGISMLSSFMQYQRGPFDEEQVEQFHKIVTILEEASDEDLSHFKIAPDRLKPTIVSSQMANVSGRPGRVTYSDKKYCDAGYFRYQVNGHATYLPSIRGVRSATETPSAAPAAKTPSTVINVHGSNFIQNSPGASITQNID